MPSWLPIIYIVRTVDGCTPPPVPVLTSVPISTIVLPTRKINRERKSINGTRELAFSKAMSDPWPVVPLTWAIEREV